MKQLQLDCNLKRGGFAARFAADLQLDGITALFGPNGAGKTTLLRVIAGLDRVGDGFVRFEGETWQDSRRRYVRCSRQARGRTGVPGRAAVFPPERCRQPRLWRTPRLDQGTGHCPG